MTYFGSRFFTVGFGPAIVVKLEKAPTLSLDSVPESPLPWERIK
jgi:hypothetical protein